MAITKEQIIEILEVNVEVVDERYENLGILKQNFEEVAEAIINEIYQKESIEQIKYQKEFENLMRFNPKLLGGNDLSLQTIHYGLKLDEPEYSSSHVLFCYMEFIKFMKTITYGLKGYEDEV